MSYQVLARKWRPKEFSELIGQEPIVTALQNALRDGRIAQAYLFSGIRGVGKTTAARLLARALNHDATQPVVATPEDLLDGADLDVIEVDAATYSKVEQVRELTESLQYKPTGRRYKVVIIDEIHRLSRQAFDALLKIVEEPPPHLVFIFATTEIEAVPATILSRCQEFHFRRVPAETLVQHLRQISEAESIAVSDTALRLLARAGEGSVRDAVALLDQLTTFGSGAIADEDAVRLLGGLDTALFERLLTAVVDGAGAEVYAVVREIEENGWDPRSAFTQFLGYTRDALHLALGAPAEQVDLPADETARLAELAKRVGYENLLRLLNQLLSSETTVRRSEAALLALEVAWLRAAELPKLVSIERLLAGAGGTGAGTESTRAASPSPSLPRPPRRARAEREASPAEAEDRAQDRGQDREQSRTLVRSTAAVSGEAVARFRAAVEQRRHALAAHLDAAQGITATGAAIEIVLGEEDELLREALERPSNRSVLDEAARAACGAVGVWRTRVDKRPAQPAQAIADPAIAAKSRASVEEHPTVQAVLDIFGGTVEAIEPAERELGSLEK